MRWFQSFFFHLFTWWSHHLLKWSIRNPWIIELSGWKSVRWTHRFRYTQHKWFTNLIHICIWLLVLFESVLHCPKNSSLYTGCSPIPFWSQHLRLSSGINSWNKVSSPSWLSLFYYKWKINPYLFISNKGMRTALSAYLLKWHRATASTIYKSQCCPNVQTPLCIKPSVSSVFVHRANTGLLHIAKAAAVRCSSSTRF